MTKDLIERLEAATGADRELDRDLYWLLRRPAAERAYWNAAMGMPRPLGERMPEGLGRIGVESASPAYTASLDASLALVGEKLPDATWLIGSGMAGLLPAWCRVDDGEMATAPTPALAVLIALLRALETK